MHHSILIIGGGSAGIATASSLFNRDKSLDIAIVEPSETHYYQPGWTMVGGGIFHPQQTVQPMHAVMPNRVTHIKAAAASFKPEYNTVTLEDGRTISYDYLVMAPGLKLDWAGIEGLEDTLGKNGVTSNYRFDLAAYTWKLVQQTKGGKAIFTQPPMPIKCAGAPQKAMYLSCSEWEKQGTLSQTDVEFCNAGPGLFGVADYVPPLMEYVKRYGATLTMNSKLVKVDGPNKIATFAQTDADGNTTMVDKEFDMLHVVPPQTGLDFVANSPLANDAGWVDVDQHSLQHTKYANVFGLGDGCSTGNAKTAAAARKQAPIVAANLLRVMAGQAPVYHYDGYGSCPLTVENGKVILAEFGYGGKIIPSFPWDSTKPRKLAWILKAGVLPWMYWNVMLKGREWLVKPTAAKS
jgi:sulfide:quinone oxidoreductase